MSVYDYTKKSHFVEKYIKSIKTYKIYELS